MRSQLSIIIFTEPEANECLQNAKEHISFKHEYNSRTDPNEPIRGKVSIIPTYM